MKIIRTACACALLCMYTGMAGAATWDLSLADFESIPATFSKQVVFSGPSAVAYDFIYPVDGPARTLSIWLEEDVDGTLKDIEWTSIEIASSSGTRTFSLTNTGATPQSCGPGGGVTSTLDGGGTLYLQDARKLKFIISGMTLPPAFQLRLNGRVAGTGAIKGQYVLTVRAVPAY